MAVQNCLEVEHTEMALWRATLKTLLKILLKPPWTFGGETHTYIQTHT